MPGVLRMFVVCPIGWSGLIVRASWASGPSRRLFLAQVADSQDAARQHGPVAPCTAWIGADPKRGRRGARIHQAPAAPGRRICGDVKGSEVSLCRLGQNEFVQSQIRHSPPQPLVFPLKLLQTRQL